MLPTLYVQELSIIQNDVEYFLFFAQQILLLMLFVIIILLGHINITCLLYMYIAILVKVYTASKMVNFIIAFYFIRSN